MILLDGSGMYDEKDKRLFDAISSAKEKIICITKSDLPERVKLPLQIMQDDSILRISSLKNKGLDELESRIISFLEEGHIPQESILVTNVRHADCLQKAFESIRKTKESLKKGLSLEFIADDLKVALQAIGEVVGEIYTEDLLGIIFSRFCIGK